MPDAAGETAAENTGRRGMRRKWSTSQEAEPGRRMSSDDHNGSQDEEIPQALEAPASTPGLKVKLKRQKL